MNHSINSGLPHAKIVPGPNFYLSLLSASTNIIENRSSSPRVAANAYALS